MVNANDVKMEIINLISRINDLSKLKLIYRNIAQVDKLSEEAESSKKQLNFRDGIVDLREGVSYEQILQEQNYKSITYEEFRTLADQIDWEHSLEELLETLD